MIAPIYLVCDGCGFFYGDIRLYEAATVDCPQCRTTVAKAYGLIDHALDYRAMFAARDDEFDSSHPEHPEHVCDAKCKGAARHTGYMHDVKDYEAYP